MTILEKMLQDLQNTYTKLTYVHDDSYWAKHIYLTKTLPEPADYLDCSFLCRNVEKPNGCDLFLMEVYSKNILANRIDFNAYIFILGSDMLSWKIYTYWGEY